MPCKVSVMTVRSRRQDSAATEFKCVARLTALQPPLRDKSMALGCWLLAFSSSPFEAKVVTTAAAIENRRCKRVYSFSFVRSVVDSVKYPSLPYDLSGNR
jgi:hypothetical protein